MTTFSLAKTLDKMNNRDKDFREMAATELYAELETGKLKLGAEEKKLVSVMVVLLEDVSDNVRGKVIKCLGPLVTILGTESWSLLLKSASNLLLAEKEEKRVIGENVVKEIIKHTPAKDSSRVHAEFVPNLLPTLNYYQALETLTDILIRLGAPASAEQQVKIANAVFPFLASRNPTQRKRACSSLSHLAVSSSEQSFAFIVQKIVEDTAKQQETDYVLAHLQTLSSIGVLSGFKLRKFVNSLVPLFVKHTADEEDEIKEVCLQGLELLLLRCSSQLKSKKELLSHASKYMKYEGFEQDNDEPMEEADEEEEDDDDDGVSYDETWKVRRGALRCIKAIVTTTNQDQLVVLYNDVASALISQFKEKEETVQAELFSCYLELLKRAAEVDESLLNKVCDEELEKMITVLSKQLKQKSTKSRRNCFGFLRELCVVLPPEKNAFAKFLPTLLPSISQSVLDKGSNNETKFETLSFLRAVLISHRPETLQRSAKQLGELLVKVVGDGNYKVSAEALLAVRDAMPALVNDKSNVHALFDKVWQKVLGKGEKEEKLATLEALTGLLVYTGGEIKDKHTESVKYLVDRLKAEVSFVTAAKALKDVSSAPQTVNLAPFVPEIEKELLFGLKKVDRSAKSASFLALQSLVKHWGSSFSSTNIVTELSASVNDADLGFCSFALQLAAAVLHAGPKFVEAVKAEVIPKTLTLLQSSLFGGNALQTLVALYKELVQLNHDNLGLLLNSIMNIGTKGDLPKQAYEASSAALGSLSSNPKDYSDVIKKLLGYLDKKDKQEVVIFSLLSLGEIGKRNNLSDVKDILKIILSNSSSSSEEVRVAAAQAYGGVTAGNLSFFLDTLLKEIERNSNKVWLMRALREVITFSSPDQLKKSFDKFVPTLLKYGEQPDAGLREFVSESLGKLAFVEPQRVFQLLKEKSSSPSPDLRMTVASSIKFSISQTNKSLDKQICDLLAHFVHLLNDADTNVIRAVLLSLQYAASQKGRNLLRSIDSKTFLPTLYTATTLREDLIRIEQVGHFKLKIDEGLETRKANFSLLLNLLTSYLQQIDLSAYVTAVTKGLRDPDAEIKRITCDIFVQLSRVAPDEVLATLEVVLDSVKAAFASDPAGKQDVPRSLVKVLAAIKQLENVENTPKFKEVLQEKVLNDTNNKEALSAFEAEFRTSVSS